MGSIYQILAGAKGILAEEEERLLKLRQEIEGEARQELDRARAELEAEGRTSQAGKLCATPFGVDVVGITELIALTGALVGGTACKSLSCFQLLLIFVLRLHPTTLSQHFSHS